MPQQTISAAMLGTEGGRKLLHAESQFKVNLEDYGGLIVQSGDILSAPTGRPSRFPTGAPYPAPTGEPNIAAVASEVPNPSPTGRPSATKTPHPAPKGTSGPGPMEALYPSPTSEPYLGAGATEAQPTGGPYPGKKGKNKKTKSKGKAKKGKSKKKKSKCKGSMPNGNGSLPKGKGSVPKGKGSSPKGKGSMPNGKGSSPKGKGSMPKGKGSLPKGKGSMPNGKGSSPKGKGSMPNGKGSSSPGATEAPHPAPTGVPGATEAPNPSPTRISPGATEAPHGGDDTDGGDDSLPPLTLNCDAVRTGKAPTNGPSTKLDAWLDIAFYKDQVKAEFVRESVYNVMNDYVRLWMLGCDEASVRRLQEATMVNAVMKETREDGTCESNIAGAACLSLYTPTTAIHTGGDTSGFQDQLDNATRKAIDDGLFAFDGVAQINIPGEDGWTDPDATPAGATSSAQEEQGLGMPGQISVAVAAVALLLVALLLVKRRRSNQEESAVKQINSNELCLDHRENKTFPMGDSKSMDIEVNDDIVDDSLTLTSASLVGAHAGMDVHECQSSLCAACVQTKQNGGISFVQVEAPSSLPRIPDDASRAYSASDTVSL